jgi:hypothetical protein
MYRFECSDCGDVGELRASEGTAEKEMQGHPCYVAVYGPPDEFDPKSLLTPQRRRELFPNAYEVSEPAERDREHKKKAIVLGCQKIDFGIEVGTMVFCTCGMSHTFMGEFAAQYVYDQHVKICDGTPGAHAERMRQLRKDEARLAAERKSRVAREEVS